MAEPGLERRVTRFAAILLVVSAIVGSGVFKKIAPMADSLRSPALVLLCWAVAGALSLMGALCNAELASMMPGSGGEFRYFKKIYGRFFSFLYGWTSFTVMKSCAVAALAYIFSESLNILLPLPDMSLSDRGWGSNISIKLAATCLIITLAYINHRGLAVGERLSRYFTIGIIVAIISFTAGAVFSPRGSVENFSASSATPDGWGLFAALFTASLSAFWGYEGWNNIGYIGEEVKNPQRNIPIALATGTVLVIILYLLMNAVYLYILPVDELAAIHYANNKIAAVEVAAVISGKTGALLLSSLILLATFSCANSTILTSSRIFFAMARDGLFLRGAARIHPRHRTPSRAVIMQCLWSIVLLWSGTFDQLTNLLIFAAFIFYGATAFGVILMRRKAPDAVRPYKVIGYPVLPIAFSLFCLLLVLSNLYQQPRQALIGLALILSGVPVYFYYIKNKKRVGETGTDH